LASVPRRVAEVSGVSEDQVWAAGRHRQRVEVRSLSCYWAVGELGIGMVEMAWQLNLSAPWDSKSVTRGASPTKASRYCLIWTKKVNYEVNKLGTSHFL
jgi:hypothetical protein